ncbi:MAG: hypothetical protein M1828_006845 [Chrysothrix sp. TS-e1954]|nr:MAG: hypothetical protein M1828_006845 [Chrysothrix sp. TS-e1954]
MEHSQAEYRPRTPIREQRDPATLPRNFALQAPHDQPPSTPGHFQSQKMSDEPPNPPRVRIKRRRPLFAHSEVALPTLSPEDHRIPSIELSEPSMTPLLPEADVASEAGFLAPVPSTNFGHHVSPPKTPLGQIFTAFDHGGTGQDWKSSSMSKIGHSISRPSSTFSEGSVSSSSSMSSWNTFPSHGDSCTSPESDFNDPFTYPETRTKLLPSATLGRAHAAQQSQRSQLQARVKPKVKWTKDMDDHLWLTYNTYLTDPKVTPFKTLPGTAPPLGVCCRVARKAKKTWKGTRPSPEVSADGDGSGFASLDAAVMRREASAPLPESPETMHRDIMPRSLSSSSQRVSWPRSESSTRKRLRELCKRKPAISPHYQRLMHTKSPPPYQSAARQRFSSPDPTSDSSSIFSTRDLNVTLATSTASSMQPGGMLSQLASESTENGQETPRSRSNAHQKSQSLQSNLGLGSESGHELRQLASPFHEQTQLQPSRPHLDSPLELHHPRPLSGSMKRRAQYQLGEEMLSDDVDMRRNVLEDIFRDPDVATGKRRVRSRGFSMGAMRHPSGSGPPSRQLSELFQPPPAETSEQDMGEDSSSRMQGVSTHAPASLAPPGLAPHVATRRLRSPFVPSPSHAGFSNTFPRSLFPQGLDSISSLEHQRQSSAGSDASSSTVQRPSQGQVQSPQGTPPFSPVHADGMNQC